MTWKYFWAAMKFAEDHKKISGYQRILFFPDPDEVEIRFLEEETIIDPVSKGGEILPFRFPPTPPDYPYFSNCAIIHPEDFERALKHDPTIFDGWKTYWDYETMEEI
jgi:hypothetical protein